MYQNELWLLSDKDLMLLKYIATETGSKTIKAINEEISRRNKEE